MSRDIDEPFLDRAAPDDETEASTPAHVDNHLHPAFDEEQEQEQEQEREGENEKAYPLEPSTLWRRLRNIFIIVFLIGVATLALRATRTKPKVIHAHRYSDEFRFRPAASPIITETLRDGRTRLRGAEPTERSVPPDHKPEKKVKKSKKSRRGKKSKTGKKGKP